MRLRIYQDQGRVRVQVNGVTAALHDSFSDAYDFLGRVTGNGPPNPGLSSLAVALPRLPELLAALHERQAGVTECIIAVRSTGEISVEIHDHGHKKAKLSRRRDETKGPI